MRVEPHAVGSYVHALKRGARGLPITKDRAEQRRFARLLFYMNDHYSDDDWEKETHSLGMFGRPGHWPERRPLVKILAWTLMPNHFHLLLKEIEDGGISKFMQKLGNSMSTYANLKHKEKGSLFQGPYKSRTIKNDAYLRYVASYIMVKNVFELYPGGLQKAAADFELAWRWGSQAYPFSSLVDYTVKPASDPGKTTGTTSPVIDKDILGELFESVADFRNCSRDMLVGRGTKKDDELKALLMDLELTKPASDAGKSGLVV